MESNLKKCSKCKKNYDLEHYTKGNRILNQCFKCRNIAIKSMNKTKCIHSKIKAQCKVCGGSGFCIHSKQKSRCKECGGAGICIHSKRKSCCKLCLNPLDITIKYMINNSKKQDIKKNRYNESEFVDYQYLFNLIDISNDECYYCECQLQYTNFTSNLATIERLDNNIGHNKKNVVIACRTCNYSKIGSR